ncbi:3-oxoadipyl-CoA thiolase, partial [Pseudomonas syringae]
MAAGNASGVKDVAGALVLASAEAVKKHGVKPRARVLGMASAAVAPRVMGIGPVPAVRKLVERLGLAVTDFDVIELNEAFASQGIAVLRGLGREDAAPQVNPNGGAHAPGQQPGKSVAPVGRTALHQLVNTSGRTRHATMFVRVGQRLERAITA